MAPVASVLSVSGSPPSGRSQIHLKSSPSPGVCKMLLNSLFSLNFLNRSRSNKKDTINIIVMIYIIESSEQWWELEVRAGNHLGLWESFTSLKGSMGVCEVRN